MLNLFLKPFKRQYQTLNRIEISQPALTSNYQYLASLDSRLKVAPVLKSNAYGHGIIETAKVLDKVGAPFLCVDSLFEAYQLLKVKVKTPVLIMGYTHPNNFKVKKLPFSYTIYDLEMAKVLNNFQWDAKVHIKVDTGMHRLGIPWQELPQFLIELKKLPNLKIEGLMSHLAKTDDHQDKLYKLQLENFKKTLETMKKNNLNPKWIHLSASGGLLNHEIKEELAQACNMVRSGIAIYGIAPNSPDSNLHPALKLTTKIAQIKKLKPGDQIGYNGTHTVKGEMTLGILPIGYYDGVDRRLSNKGVFLIDGVKCPIVGRISMNITTIDISKIKKPHINQEVVVFSNNHSDPNSIINAAETCQTIPYDLLVRLAASTKREIV